MVQTKSKLIAKSSPLYEYWKTPQDDIEEKKRLLILNNKSPAYKLFEQEPYKWEILFQSIVREIYNGDISSIKGLKILLETIKVENQIIVLKNLEIHGLINYETLELIKNFDFRKEKQERKLMRSLKILCAIFFNPYEIVIKRKKIHIYENTGYLINQIRQIFIF